MRACHQLVIYDISSRQISRSRINRLGRYYHLILRRIGSCITECSTCIRCTNELQCTHLIARRNSLYEHIIQVEICAAWTIVTGSVEINNHRLTGICRQVNRIFRPRRDTRQIALERIAVCLAFFCDQNKSGTTRRVLPPERELRICRQVNARQCKYVGIAVAITIRIKTQAFSFVASSI